MSFAIEVPGAASPLNRVELCRQLQSASSHAFSKRQAAGEQLSTWEAHADYYPSLQTIFLDNTLPREIRLLAVIQLKNGIDKYWRQGKNAIPPAEKQLIRSNLFRGTIHEMDKQLALHHALVLAKILRIDFPGDWPDPFKKINDLLRSHMEDNQQQLATTLLLLLRIVKELGTARLRKSQAALQSVTPELVYILGQIYDGKATQWNAYLANGQGQEDEAKLAIENSLTAFKILRRLLVVGYVQPHKDSTVQQVWAFSQTQLGQLLTYLGPGSLIPEFFSDLVGKHLLQFAKLHISMAEQHPASFAVLPSSLDLTRAYWDLAAQFAVVFDKSEGIRQGGAAMGDEKPKVEGPLFERLALKSLLLMRACVKLAHQGVQGIKYRSREQVSEDQESTKSLKTHLFTDDFIVQVVNTIITHLFVFRKADLDSWEEDPQEWEQQEETQGHAYEWEVRPCAERLFLDLLTYYKPLLLQPLLAYFATIQNPNTDVVAREAVYTAMGLSAPVVQEEFDFDSVVQSSIIADVQRADPICRILRRRIAIVLSQWVPVKISNEARPVVYEIMRRFLDPQDPNNDIVVRITAAREFKPIIDEFGFDGEMFLPYAADVLTQLINLLRAVDNDEPRLAVLETTRSLIDRMEVHVSHFGDMIMSALPGIWELAGDLNFLMKQSVLAIIQSLVVSMKSESQRYQSFILPLLAEAMQDNSDVHLYLMEDALDLWSNVLLQSTSPLSPDLLSFSRVAIKSLADQTENAFFFLSIVGSYIILAPEAMLADDMRKPLFHALSTNLDSKHRERVSLLTKYTEALIRLSHELSGAAGLQVVVQDMVETGFLQKIFESIHDAYEAHQTTGPKMRHPRVNSLTLADYFTILSRIAVLEPALFTELLARLGPLEQVWAWLSAEWFAIFDTMADLFRLKVNLLALTRLFEVPQPMRDLALTKLQDYFSMWTSVLVQILSDEVPGDDALCAPSDLSEQEWETPKDVREKALWASDPVKTVQSLTFVKQTLHNVVQNVGGEQAFQEHWACNVDGNILAGFQALGKPKEGGH
ncbi:armadillo-type protein [Xylariomycetidae sp. FL0641]|nr:armadillo-type protein [Xylariomycetidae sp. FL0641]